MSNGIIIYQYADTKIREGILLTTSIVDSATGEIYSQDIRVKNSFYLDSIVESVLDDVIKQAESMGKKVVAIDSPFIKYINARKKMMQGGD